MGWRGDPMAGRLTTGGLGLHIGWDSIGRCPATTGVGAFGSAEWRLRSRLLRVDGQRTRAEL